MADKKSTPDDASDQLAKALADQGKLIEAGWIGLRLIMVPANAPQAQLDAMRFVFMAGAQHLFGAIMQVLGPDKEPTDTDFKRMTLINDELEAFTQEMEARFGKLRRRGRPQ